MTIEEKYSELRNEITDGCLVLISKNTLVSKIIRWFDNAEFSHIMLVFEKSGALFVIDSNPDGVHPELLSARINKCDNFCIIKPLCSSEIIQMNLSECFERAKLGIKYDFKNAVKEAFNRKFNTKFRIKLRDGHDICSDWTEPTAVIQKMITQLPLEPFPQDYLRYRDELNTKLVSLQKT